MRKVAGLLLCSTLMLPAVSALATDDAEYKDDFGDGNYSGNDGSLEFAAPWAEFGDTGGAGSGTVHVGPEYCSNNECLHIEGYGLVALTYGATRYADLSVFEHVTLSFDIQVVPQGPTTTDLVVEMFDGSKWNVVKTFDLANATNQHKDIDVTQHADPDSAVRFRVLDVLSGGILGLDLLYTGYATIDRVTLSGELASSGTSTTSTTAPTTTSTSQPTTTTSKPPSTTSTTSGSVTSTTAPHGTTSKVGSGDGGTGSATQPSSGQTTTTLATTTSTSEDDDSAGAIAAGPVPPDGPSTATPSSGLRVTAGGVIADYRQGMMGDLDMSGIEVLGFEVDANFSMAVEFFETAKFWIAGLALVIAAAIIAGLDRKRGLSGALVWANAQRKAPDPLDPR